jgi:hypothetical protein
MYKVFHHCFTIPVRNSLFETSLATLTCPGNLKTMQILSTKAIGCFGVAGNQKLLNAVRVTFFQPHGSARLLPDLFSKYRTGLEHSA